MNLIFVDERRFCYALLKTGEIIRLPTDDILEICDDKVGLEIRRSQWEAHYRTAPQHTIRPPWLEEAEAIVPQVVINTER